MFDRRSMDANLSSTVNTCRTSELPISGRWCDEDESCRFCESIKGGRKDADYTNKKKLIANPIATSIPTGCVMRPILLILSIAWTSNACQTRDDCQGNQVCCCESWGSRSLSTEHWALLIIVQTPGVLAPGPILAVIRVVLAALKELPALVLRLVAKVDRVISAAHLEILTRLVEHSKVRYHSGDCYGFRAISNKCWQ
jgi:hypothetical protein